MLTRKSGRGGNARFRNAAVRQTEKVGRGKRSELLILFFAKKHLKKYFKKIQKKC